MNSWDRPETAVYYEAFCRSFDRYSQANAVLIAHAEVGPRMSLLDLAAGTGRTTEATLPRLGSDGRVLCVEPSAAMRAEGMRRLSDDRISWSEELPIGSDAYDRILCGAAVWQLWPIGDALARLAGLLRSGGALVFNIPALYLAETDEPGEGSDPMLMSLPALLHTEYPGAPEPQFARFDAPPPLTRGIVDATLSAAGLRVESWRFRLKVTQDAYAQWLKIPATSTGLLPDMSPEERARCIDSALGRVDRSSWKWEGWSGWTAWKH